MHSKNDEVNMELRSWSRAAAIALFVATACTFSCKVTAQEKPNEKGGESKAGAASTVAAPDSITEGSVTVGGQAIAYRAVAGTMTVGSTDQQDATLAFDGKHAAGRGREAAGPDKPEEAPATARMFYVAYFRKDATDETHRPVMFMYNGGPGSATMWLHMGSFGPKRVVTAGRGAPGGRAVQDRQQRVLACWTRATWCSSMRRERDSAGSLGRIEEKAFWGVDPDAHAFTSSSGKFLTKYDRWNSPKYMFGESYGTPRSAVLAADAEECGSERGDSAVADSELRQQRSTGRKSNPGRGPGVCAGAADDAATAFYFHKLPSQPAALEPFLAEVEQYALGDYMEALLQGSELPERRSRRSRRSCTDTQGCRLTICCGRICG